MAQQLLQRTTVCFPVPKTKVQGIPCPPLASMGTHAHTHTHDGGNKNKIIVFKIKMIFKEQNDPQK